MSAAILASLDIQVRPDIPVRLAHQAILEPVGILASADIQVFLDSVVTAVHLAFLASQDRV